MATDPVLGDGPTRRLVGFSAERTLVFFASDGEEGRLVKVFEAGSPADAEREALAARTLAGPGIARALDVTTWDGRPALELEWIPGEDLGSRISRHGPLEAHDAARIALALARVLRRVNGLGWVHADVKPSNVMLGIDDGVTLLDLEHARVIDTDRTSDRFTGGTHGFAPPEAYEGAPATAAFDVFGFGCCLLAALTGHERCGVRSRRRERLLQSLPDRLRALCEACLSEDAAARPDWNTVTAELEAVLASRRTPTEIALERARLAILGAELESATELLTALDSAQCSEMAAVLRALQRRAQRLDAHVRDDIADPVDHPSLATIATRTRGVASVLARFPGRADARHAAHELRIEIARKLPDVPALSKRRARDGDFDGALALLADARRAIAAANTLGGIPVADSSAGTVPPVLRDPERFLALAEREVEAERTRFERFAERIARGEAALDLATVHATVDEAVATYGGASEITASLKERLHRFEFSLSRIAGAARAVDECGRQLGLAQVAVDLAPVRTLVERAARRATEPRSSHCRALLRALEDLRAEHPDLDDRIQAAIRTLHDALAALTDAAWATLARAESLFEAAPIPIRPLQADLNRVDRLDLAGCLIDLPDRSRSDLLDALETVRVRVERARAMRDRLARGAEEALDQGHLTTALYDMERVASRFDAETSRDDDSTIGSRYREARQLKEEIGEATRLNHELAARFRELTADPEAHSEARLDVLRERMRQLEFLCHNVGEHRRQRYASDLAQAQFTLFEETAEAESARFLASDPSRRAHIAEQVLGELRLLVPSGGWDESRRRDAEKTIARWRQYADEHPPRGASWRRRLVGAVSVVFVVAATAVGWSALAADRSLSQLASDLEPALFEQRDEAMPALRAFVDVLERSDDQAAARAARALLALVDAEVVDASWLQRVRETLTRLDQAAAASDHTAALISFGRVAHTVALRSARSRLDDEAVADHLARTAVSRFAIPAAVAAELR